MVSLNINSGGKNTELIYVYELYSKFLPVNLDIFKYYV